MTYLWNLFPFVKQKNNLKEKKFDDVEESKRNAASQPSIISKIEYKCCPKGEKHWKKVVTSKWRLELLWKVHRDIDQNQVILLPQQKGRYLLPNRPHKTYNKEVNDSNKFQVVLIVWFKDISCCSFFVSIDLHDYTTNSFFISIIFSSLFVAVTHNSKHCRSTRLLQSSSPIPSFSCGKNSMSNFFKR